MKKIMLDAGHYKNYNKSNVLPSYYEGNMTFKLANFIKSYIEKNYPIKVNLTRSSITKDLALYTRGYMSKGYDAFYSLHSNFVNDPTVDRVVIIQGLGTNNDSYSKKLGDKISSIMGVSQKTQVFEKSHKGGEYYGVLRGAKSAGVKDRFIIEHSFHSNLKATKFLSNDNNLLKLAIAEGDIMAERLGVKKVSKDGGNKGIWDNGNYGVWVECTENLNLREGRGTGFKVIKTLKKGTKFTVEYVHNNWGSTWNFGQGGYVCMDYVKRV